MQKLLWVIIHRALAKRLTYLPSNAAIAITALFRLEAV